MARYRSGVLCGSRSNILLSNAGVTRPATAGSSACNLAGVNWPRHSCRGSRRAHMRDACGFYTNGSRIGNSTSQNRAKSGRSLSLIRPNSLGWLVGFCRVATKYSITFRAHRRSVRWFGEPKRSKGTFRKVWIIERGKSWDGRTPTLTPHRTSSADRIERTTLRVETNVGIMS